MKAADATQAADAPHDSAPVVRTPSGPPIGSQAVIASMRQHGIAFTADNYAVWHCYLTASNTALKRAIDIILSNGMAVGENTLRTLYTRHFCHASDALALRDLATRSLLILSRASELAPMEASMLAQLGQDMRDMVEQSERMTRLLGQSEQRVAELERFLDDARQEASTDGLTGLANRRAFDAALRSKAGDAMNDGTDLACIMVDIDHFKRVNDCWGHPAGDEILRMVAGILTGVVRGQDIVARYGGEEFALILPETDRHGALPVAENLRSAVERHALLSTQAGDLRITISAGAACYDPGENLGAWLARADAALYAAKHAGRNRVVFGEDA